MTSTSEPRPIRGARALAALALFVAACSLERPPDPPGVDCATLERAAERFPELCGEPTDDEDAATDERGDAGTGEGP